MLVDRVLADLDLPADEDRQGTKACAECPEPVSAKALCRRHYDRARYRANREAWCARESARSKARYWSDPEARRILSREKQRRRRAADPTLAPREWRRWRETNLERAKEVSRNNMRLYRQRHPGRAEASYRRWLTDHPEAVAAARHRAYLKHYANNRQEYFKRAAERRARKKAVQIGPVDFDAILIRDAGRCGICSQPVPPSELHYDHIIPLARGGAHSQDNLQVAHARCNLRKSAKC